MKENSIDGTVNQIADAIVDATMECVKKDSRHRLRKEGQGYLFPEGIGDYQVTEKTREAVKARVAKAIGTANADECRENLRSMVEKDIFYAWQIEADHFWNDAAAVGLIVIDGERLTGNTISVARSHVFPMGTTYHNFVEKGPVSLQFTDAKYAGRGFSGRVFFEDSTLRDEKCNYGGLGPGHFHLGGIGVDLADKVIKIFENSCKVQK